MDKKGTIKLADFGASKKIEDLATMGSAGSGAKSIRGTPYWMVSVGGLERAEASYLKHDSW